MLRSNRISLARLFNFRTLLGVLVVAVIALSVLTTVAFTQIAGSQADTCQRVHTLTSTLDRMIADSRKSLDAYVRDGTITVAQRDRELRRIRMQREELGGADCPPHRFRRP